MGDSQYSFSLTTFSPSGKLVQIDHVLTADGSVQTSLGNSQYSFSLTTFSPSGKLVQIDHVLTADGSWQTSLGIKGDRSFCMPQARLMPLKRKRNEDSEDDRK